MMWGGDMGSWGWWWMLIGGSLMWVLLIGAVAAVIWAASRTDGDAGERRSPTGLDILKTRYAHGDITRSEFEQARGDLA